MRRKARPEGLEPSKDRTDTRRRGILLAAGRVFIKNGFRLATMEDIAAAAGVAVGTLYHHFRNKEHLCASLEAEAERILNERLRVAAAKPLPPPFGLLAISRAYADYFSEYPDLFRIRTFFQYETERADSRSLEKERRTIDRLGQENLQIVVDKIREGQKHGMFRSNLDPVAVAMTLWASLIGILVAGSNLRMLVATGLDVEKLVSTAAFLHAVGLNSETAIPPAAPDPNRSSGVSLDDLQEVLRAASWITPRMIFAGMKITFQPQTTRGLHESYVYRISGPQGGVWSVRIDDGKIAVAERAVPSPTASFEMTDKSLVRLVTGELEATELLMRGELRVRGDLQCAARLASYFRPAAEAKPKSQPKPQSGRLAEDGRRPIALGPAAPRDPPAGLTTQDAAWRGGRRRARIRPNGFTAN